MNVALPNRKMNQGRGILSCPRSIKKWHPDITRMFHQLTVPKYILFNSQNIMLYRPGCHVIVFCICNAIVCPQSEKLLAHLIRVFRHRCHAF